MKKQMILLDNSPTISEDYSEDANILNAKISNPTVKNIAVVAKLGAGKSSVIETYLDKYRKKQKINKKMFINESGKINKVDYKQAKKDNKSANKKIDKKKFIKISLSTFNGKDYNEESVERSILQQLLYSQSKQKLPNSKIERTNKPSIWKSIIFASLLTIFIISSILFGTELSTINVFPNTKWIKYLFLGLITVSFGLILFYCIYFKSLKRIKYKDFELETKNENISSSIINKLIDEILYFFECIDVNLVIFEDLDRLPDTEIFVKLRELNTILNNSSNRKCKKITFLYAVKSEVIENFEERAKFFDFILSIVPIVNPTTTEEKIREFIKKINNDGDNLKLKEEYIKDISLYIPDMRILKNTFNDYIITRNRIVNDKNKNRISNEKLFTLSLYRNLFPAEYTKLENKNGVLAILLNKKVLSEVLLKDVKKEILELETKINEVNNEQANDFDELKFLLNGILLESSYTSYRSPLIKVKAITTFENIDYNTVEHPIHRGYCVNLSAQDVGRISSIDFLKREKNIKLKTENKLQDIKIRIENLNKEKQIIYSLPYEDLVERLGIQKVFNNDHINENKDFSDNVDDAKFLNFLKFAIKNKYLDDRYSEYTHNLSSSIISQADIEFIKNVQNGNSDFAYQIENIKEVFDRLKKEDFNYCSVINKTVLKNIHLLSNKSKKQNLLNTLSSCQEDSFTFIIEFFAMEENEEIIKLAGHLKNDLMLASNVIKSNLTDQKKDVIINTLFKSVNNINLINNEQCITTYMSTKKDIGDILKDLSIEEIKNLFEAINPSFKNLNKDLTTNEVMKLIIESRYYEININNLLYVLKVDNDSCGDLMSNVMKFVEIDKGLKNYIEDNLNIFINNILINDKVINSKENSLFATSLLMNSSVEADKKMLLIQKYDILIEEADKVDISLLACLILNNKIKPTWSNLQFSFERLEDKSILINFIQINIENVSSISVDENTSDLILYLLNNIEENNVLSLLATKILGALKLTDITSLNNAVTLLKFKKIDFLVTDFKNLLENNDLLIEYLCCFEDEISKHITTFFTNELTTDKINTILLNDKIPETLKQKIIIQFYNKLKIDGFEVEYANLFINHKFTINEMILFQFTNVEKNIDKFSLVGLVNFDYTNQNTLLQIKEFLKSCGETFKALFESKKEFKMDNTDENINTLLKLQKARILTYSKYKDKLTIKIA